MTDRAGIRRSSRTAVLTAGTAVLVAACGSGSSSSSSTAAPARPAVPSQTKPASPTVARSGHVRVLIGNYAFTPATMVVSAGTKVTFTNHDQTAHTATSAKPGFDSGTIAPGKSRTVTLSRPGRYAYVCQFHPFMHGVVIVRQG
jgi:plastocyanin